MKDDAIASHLQSIAEFVLEEDKIVTYKWLSKTCGIHVNISKQLLYQFATEQNNKSSGSVSVTYLLAGLLKNGVQNFTIVNDANLEKAKAEFEEISSEHVYSVQKGKPLEDFQLLYAVDMFDRSSERFVGPIRCEKSTLREITTRKVVQDGKQTEKPVEKSNGFTKSIGGVKNTPATTSKKTEPVSTEVKKSPQNNDSGKKQEVVSPQKNEESRKKNQSPKKTGTNSIASMFSAQNKAKQDVKKTTPKNATKKGGMAGFLNSGSPSKQPVISNNDIEKTAKDEEKKGKELEKKDKMGKGNGKRKSKKKGKKVEEETNKKRKRIRVFSDSEDSEEEMKDRSPSPMEVEPEPEPEVEVALLSDPEPAETENDSSITKNKRKKRKIIDKLIMNEDGYMETRKEVTFATDSEEEVEAKKEEEKKLAEKKTEKVRETKTTKKKQQQNIGKKQASLLSFFKKS